MKTTQEAAETNALVRLDFGPSPHCTSFTEVRPAHVVSEAIEVGIFGIFSVFSYEDVVRADEVSVTFDDEPLGRRRYVWKSRYGREGWVS